MYGAGKAIKGLTEFLSELVSRGGNARKNFEHWNEGNKAVYNRINTFGEQPEAEGMVRPFYRGLRDWRT